MRIVTWNMAGNWRSGHEDLLREIDADLLLLTEVHTEAALDAYHQHRSQALMLPTTSWAAIFARSELVPLPDPHQASASALVAGTTVISSVLPWPQAGDLWPWGAPDHTERMTETIEAVTALLVPETLWGGDWNTPLVGNISGFTKTAQSALLAALSPTPLQVPTVDLPAKGDRQSSIDHIAVPESWKVLAAERVRTGGLSDHDAYWIEVVPPPS